MDHETIINALIKLIRQRTGLLVVPSGTTGDKPDYPYASYTITSPYLPIHRGHENEGVFTEQWECVISLTFYAENDAIEAMSFSKNVAQSLKMEPSRSFLNSMGLSWIRNEGFGSRDTFLTVDLEKRHGFDVTIRTAESIRHTDEDSIETIEEIT